MDTARKETQTSSKLTSPKKVAHVTLNFSSTAIGVGATGDDAAIPCIDRNVTEHVPKYHPVIVMFPH